MFVTELTRLFTVYADGTPMENTALTATMTMPALLLQKPHTRSRSAEHVSRLKERLDLWAEGDIESLLQEGRSIQARLPKSIQVSVDEGEHPRSVAKLVGKGSIQAAIRRITDKGNTGTLPLNSLQPDNRTVKEHLLEKHPHRNPALIETISQEDPEPEPHPVIFEGIDGTMIRDIAQRMTGSAGPSGIDSAGWKRLCSSYGKASDDLCRAIARVARRLCSSYVDPEGLKSFVACRLIALDKDPGVRPIGIGEVLRRIIGKAVLTIASDDIRKVVGTQQLCAGQISGSEAGVHAMRVIKEEPDSEAILMVDASNAFNSLNREAALRNVRILCPVLAPIIINTYREDSPLYIDGEVILSEEGTTQGDPLAMSMYAIGTMPLIRKLPKDSKSVWFADDATAGGQLDNLKGWWEGIRDHGPAFGYLPNASKSWLIVKEEALQKAQSIFNESGINITVNGKRHLGAPLGTNAFAQSFVETKVADWVNEIKRLSVVARTQPQAAYAVLTHGFMGRWAYLMRSMPGIEGLLQPLEDAIRHHLLPAITGRTVITEDERKLLALPVRHGGLGIAIPSEMASNQFGASSTITEPLVSRICQQPYETSDEYDVNTSQIQLRKEVSRCRRMNQQEEASNLKESISTTLQKSMDLAAEKGASSWLTAIPIEEHGFTLHKQAFKDALCIRYSWEPTRLPTHCSCGAPFSTIHAFSCSKGAFPSIRHDHIRDLTAQLMTEVCSNVETEPTLLPLSGETFQRRTANVEANARQDIRAQGFWGGQRESAFFDVRVFNPYAPSNSTGSQAANYRRHEKEKRRTYERRILEVEHGSFTPLVLSTTGGWGPSAQVTFKRLASLIAAKYKKSYSQTMSMIRCKVAFSLIDSALMCLRGARSSHHRPIRSLDLTDTPVDLIVNQGRI